MGYPTKICRLTRDLDGIILLDHHPEFAEIERQIFAKISQFVRIHQLCNPGKFRLGYSGAYLEDVAWCNQEDLPSWVPHHEVEIVNYNAPWQSSVSIDAKSKYHRVVVERSDHCVNCHNNFTRIFSNYTRRTRF